MATHSSILSWKIPWIEEPGGRWGGTAHRVDRSEATEQANINDADS